MADLVNAVVLATLSGAGASIVFPLVLIPAYGVPRSLLIHSYSLLGLLRKKESRREHAMANTVKPAVPGSYNVPIPATSRGQRLEF